MRRRDFIAGLGAAVLPSAARAQQAGQMRRVGVLTPETAGFFRPVLSGFREALATLGWVEGRNVRIEIRTVFEELAPLNPEVIFAFSGPAARVARQHTQTIPIVFLGGGDPVEAEGTLVGSVARPTGNITGFANNFASLGGKWLELLKQAVPRLTTFAYIHDPTFIQRSSVDASLDAGAAKLGLKKIDMPFHNPDEIERAITAFAAQPDGGLLIAGVFQQAPLDAALRLALEHRLPTVFGAGRLVADGLLMSYGPDSAELARGAASYVDRILRGAKPGELPVQYPTKIPVVLNLKTAKAMGLTIPESFILRADEVIE